MLPGVRVVTAFFLLIPGSAFADPNQWSLDGPVLQGDGVARGEAVTIEDVVINDLDGALTLRACCGLTALAACEDSSTYEIGWTLDHEVDVLDRGEAVVVALSNTRTAGTCTDIDPIVTLAGDNGNPADSLPGLGVTFDGPVGIFDDALAGGRFYTTNSDAHTDHDGSARTVAVYDVESMLERGYFHLDVGHRWGLQYEITWLYRATEDGEVPADKICGHAPGAPAWALAALVLAAVRRRRSVTWR